MKFRIAFFACMLAASNLVSTITGVRTSRGQEATVVFEGTIEKIGDLPPISCGIMLPYQLAKYRVEKAYVGIDLPDWIVVDHIACNRGEMLRGFKPGNKVIVIAKIKKEMLQRYNAEGIRSPDERVNFFYVAERVACISPCEK